MQAAAKYAIFILASLTLLFSACKSKKYHFEQTVVQIPQSKLDSILSNHNFDFEWYSIKSKIKLLIYIQYTLSQVFRLVFIAV